MSVIALLSLCIWLYLFFAHGDFWKSRPELPDRIPAVAPSVDIVVPARDEAETIHAAIGSLLAQDYPGSYGVVLVDDDSTDGTAAAAGTAANLRIIRGAPKPPGWSGKLWALNQGISVSNAQLLLLTDADIVHDPRHLASLVAQLESAELDFVSEMVRLNCTSLAERALVPAFVYFFQMLYPFAKVNDPRSSAAAAAGGTVLIRRETLERIGGIATIKGALIDDVALAGAVKPIGRIFLGHSRLAASIRRYPEIRDIWRMISRTAFTQLRHSAVLLALTLVALALVWLAPPWNAAFGRGAAQPAGICACVLAAASYLPTLMRYQRNKLWVLALPAIALFYMAATVASAVNFWRGKGANWKNRAYQN
ncbi:MAG TPA: glycosyltransferase [Steroidobacteraceae bacterium]